jgi:hypothetical protein
LIDCVSAEDQEVAMPFNLQSVMCSKPWRRLNASIGYPLCSCT